jgi:hypothetical protein
MLVLLSFLDSGTGEQDFFEINVPEFTGEAVVLAFDRYLAKAGGDDPALITIPNHRLEAWTVAGSGHLGAFILSSYEPYFGDMFVTGTVHLDFVAGFNGRVPVV